MLNCTNINTITFDPFDLLAQPDRREKIAHLIINGVPEGLGGRAEQVLCGFRQHLESASCSDVRVVVFGGGTGLSNIIGGDSRQKRWGEQPFEGLKEIFPQTKSIVCVTDDGGSTGELLKDSDIIALGDIRHVLLSSIQSARLCCRHTLTRADARQTKAYVASIFNYRFISSLSRNDQRWQEINANIAALPQELATYFSRLIRHIYTTKHLQILFERPHCLGNLLIAAAIDEYRAEYGYHQAVAQGLLTLADIMGCGERAVMPSTSTPSQLVIRYANGVEIPGEHKLDNAGRGVAIERAVIGYSGTVRVYDEVLEDIATADIILFAPGSLFSSIIPVLQVPGIADAVRGNKKALKLLISNIWVQEGETDISGEEPDRRFYVSDMITAYERNIPGGIVGLFREVLAVSLHGISASILQRYALERKIPIFLDRDRLTEKGLIPVECDIYSKILLQENSVIQHDPAALARVVRGLYLGRQCYEDIDDYLFPYVQVEGHVQENEAVQQSYQKDSVLHEGHVLLPNKRYKAIVDCIDSLSILDNDACCPITVDAIKEELVEILWDNPIIALSHLDCFEKIEIIGAKNWRRQQQWDNLFSYFDPVDSTIKIRAKDMVNRHNIELAFCIGLGESLLGNYAERKEIHEIVLDGIMPGRIYHLYLRDKKERCCFFTDAQLAEYMHLARMFPADDSSLHFTRLLNDNEGFTPPGLLMGLAYAWYIDNRLASHIEYKMSVLQIKPSRLIPNQIYMAERRRKTIDFFRDVIFAPYWGE